MRIEAYTQVQQLYQTQKTQRPQSTAKKGFMDQLRISSTGKDIQTAKAAVAQSSDIRYDVVNPIKEQVQNGTYDVDTESFAEKLYSRYQGMR